MAQRGGSDLIEFHVRHDSYFVEDFDDLGLRER